MAPNEKLRAFDGDDRPDNERSDEGLSELASAAESDEPSNEGIASESEAADGKRRIHLLVPPSVTIGENGLPMCIYIPADGETMIWWAENEDEAAEIERFRLAAEAFDYEDPSTHVVEF